MKLITAVSILSLAIIAIWCIYVMGAIRDHGTYLSFTLGSLLHYWMPSVMHYTVSARSLYLTATLTLLLVFLILTALVVQEGYNSAKLRRKYVDANAAIRKWIGANQAKTVPRPDIMIVDIAAPGPNTQQPSNQ